MTPSKGDYVHREDHDGSLGTRGLLTGPLFTRYQVSNKRWSRKRPAQEDFWMGEGEDSLNR